MGLVKVKRTLQIDSADRDIVKYQTNGDFLVYLPRSYKNVTSLRLKGAQFKQIPFFKTDSQAIVWLDGKDPYGTGITPANNSNLTGSYRNKISNNTITFGGGTQIYNNGITSSSGQPRANWGASAADVITLFIVGTYKVSSTGTDELLYNDGPSSGRHLSVTLERSDTTSPYKVGIRARIRTITPPSTTNSTNVYTNPDTYVTYGKPQLIELVINNTDSAINDIGSNIMSASINSNELKSNSLASGFFTGQSALMYINLSKFDILHEILSFKNVLSLEKRQNIEKYLSTKWNLDMPVSHPVKNEIFEKDPYYFLIEIEGLNRCDETCVAGNKSSFTDKFFAKIPAVSNSDGLITYNDKNLQENINYYTPSIENLDRLHIKTRTHDQQNSDKFIAWSGDCTLTFEIEYMENELDVKTDEN